MRGRALIMAAALTASVAVQGQTGGVPQPIKNRVNELVTACARAGGTLGDMSGQGRFVIPGDFNGDGRTDFLVSEGNFPCTGRPALFRPDGLANVQLWLGESAGGATLAFEDRLLAYRVLDGRPAKLQIARRGPGCGAARCGDELRWNASALRFDEIATDGRKVAARPAAGSAAAAPAVAAAGGADAARPGSPTAAPLTVQAGARASYLAACRKQTLASNPQAAEWVDQECADRWKKAVAAGPLADVILAAVPARAGERLSGAALKSRLPQVRWQAKPRTYTGRQTAASGQFGVVSVDAYGTAAAPAEIVFNWRGENAEIPYDLVGALTARDVKLNVLGCSHRGPEVTIFYIVEAPDRPVFGVKEFRVHTRIGDTQNFSVDLAGRLPDRARLRADQELQPWQDDCAYF